MKKNFTITCMGVLLIVSLSARAQNGLFISEVTDPADDYTGRFIEIYNAGSEAVDFDASLFYLSRQSNGGTTWGEVQLTGVIPAGEAYVVGGSAFETLYGFAPHLVTGILIGNGDDAYCLFRDGNHSSGILHDIYGEIDVDGSGTLWEYEDSRALRISGVKTPNPLWNLTEWEITPANMADCNPGVHHVSSPGDTIPFPGDFIISLPNDTVHGIQSFNVPVMVSELTAADDIISYQFDLDFNSTLLEYTGYSLSGTIADGGTVEVNPAVSGRLSVSYMNTTALTGAGNILILQFDALGMGTSGLVLSGAYLNSMPVEKLVHGSVLITESSPPTAVVSYNDTVNRFADTLLIIATFDESLDPSKPVKISFTGAVSLDNADMTRLSDTVYIFPFRIPKAEGEVLVSLSNGTDLWGNPIVSVPAEGGTFIITGFRAGDVDDDGLILAYDAALTLQHSVGIDPLPETDPLPWEAWRDSTANVDGLGEITAYDAAMILRYSAGILSVFPSGSSKTVPAAEILAEVRENMILFYSYGELYGLNIAASDDQNILGDPEVLAGEFMSAFNINETGYRIGLCTTTCPKNGSRILRIPFHRQGSLTITMNINGVDNQVTLDLVTGRINQENAPVSIYPNPTSGKLKIDGITGPSDAVIYNIHGALKAWILSAGGPLEIDISALPAGMYMIRIDSDEGQFVDRFVKN